MDATLMSTVYSAGAETILPTWALGLAGGMGVLFVASVIAVLISTVVYWPMRKRAQRSNLFGVAVVALIPQAAGSVRDQAQAVFTALTDFLNNIIANLRLLLIFGALAIAALVLLWWHPTLLTIAYQGIHCYTQPFVESIILPIANTLRLLYSFVYAFINFGVTVIFAWTSLPFRVLRACTSLATIGNIIGSASMALLEFVTALAQWLATGLFFGGRIELLLAFQNVGLAVNASRPIWDCLCDALGPVWDFALALPQLPTLHTSLDCLVNVPVRVIQLPVLAIIRFELPHFSPVAEEVQCALTGAGDTVEDVVTLVLELFAGIFSLILNALQALSAEARQALTAASSFSLTPLMRRGPHSASAQTLAASWRPEEAGLVQFARQWQPFGDQLLDGLDLIVTFGFDTLMRLANTPYTRIVTEPLSTLVGAANMTLETIFHPIDAFGSVAGLAYFQVGHLGDRLRVAADAVAQLSVIIDARLPCGISEPLQVIVSLPEALMELFWGFIFHAAFSPWSVGEPGPTDCDLVPCDGQPGSRPADWSFLDIFPDYYAWNGSRLRRSYYKLLDGGECSAYLFGCDTVARNNVNGTNVTDPICANAPAACLARNFNRVAVEVINTSLSIIFLLPDIVRFNRDYLTARDLPLPALKAAIGDLIDCISTWLDTLDENDDNCRSLTPTEPGLPPPPAPRPPGPPPPDGQSTLPARWLYDCRPDGRAYYLDGRAVVITYTTLVDPFDSREEHLRCDPLFSRACAVAGSSGGLVQIIGSGPEENVTILVSAVPGLPRLRLLVHNGTDNTIYLGTGIVEPLNFTYYGLSGLLNESCDAPLPLADPLPDYFACRNGSAIIVEPYDTADDARFAGILLAPNVTGSGTFYNPVNCTTDLAPSSVPCSGNLTYLGQLVSARVGTSSPYVETPVLCGDPFLTCVYNKLALFPTVPDLSFGLNDSIAVEVFYRQPGSIIRLPVPCTRVPPPTAFCNGSVFSVQGVNAEQYFGGVNTSADPPLCDANPLLVAPSCRRLTLSYTSGATAVIELEGADIRVWLNDTRTQVPCQYASAAISASSTTSSAEQPMGPDRFGLDMQRVIAATQLRVTNELKRPTGNVMRLTRAQAAFIAARPSAAFARVFGVNVSEPFYRKENLLCCFSATVRAVGDFFVATVFEVVLAARDLLALPAFVEEGFAVPTFNTSRDALREALCKLACTVTQILPDMLNCDNAQLTVFTRCSTGASCARNSLCALFDIPLLLVDYLVDILTTLRSLATGHTPGVDSNVLGVNCAPDDTGGCFVSVISYIVLKTVKVFTTAVRKTVAFFDCALCAFTRFVVPGSDCLAIFSIIIEPLLTAIEGIAGPILTAVLNIIIGVIEFFVYLFTDFTKAFTIGVERIVANIILLGQSIFEIIVSFLLKIPGVSAVINFILSVARTGCTIIEDLTRLTIPTADFGCGSIPNVKKKRGSSASSSGAAGWITPLAVWSAGAEANAACDSRMTALNASDVNSLTVNEEYEVLYCMLAGAWVGPNATTLARTAQGSECDTLMPALYSAGKQWPQIDDVTQARAIPCLEGRAYTIRARATNATWMPHDLFYNPRRWAPLMLDLWKAHSVYTQYNAEQTAAPDLLLSTGFRAVQRAMGGTASVAHLDALAAGRLTLTATQVRAAVAARPVAAYAAAAVAGSTTFMAQALDADRIAHFADQFWPVVYKGSGLSNYTSFAQHMVGGVADFFAARLDGEQYLSVALGPDMYARMANTSTSGAGIGGLVDAVMLDLPSIFVKATRTAQTANPPGSSAFAAAAALPGALVTAGLGTALFIAQSIGGTADGAIAWLETPLVQSYLAAHAGVASHALTGAAAGFRPTYGSGNLFGAAAARLSAGLAALLPTHSPLYAASRALTQGLNGPAVNAASARRAALSRFGARVVLTVSAIASGRAAHASFTDARMPMTVRTTADDLTPPLPCQFYIINATDNSISYPLCDECPGLDAPLGKTIGAGLLLLAHLSPNSTSRASFRASSEAFYQLKAYLEDRTLPAILGDSPELPARWPWKRFNNVRVLGDDRPNKQRFNDVMPLATLTYNYILDAYEQSGGQSAVDSLSASVASAANARPYTEAAGRSINTQVTRFLRSAWRLSAYNASAALKPVNISADSTLLRANLVRLPDHLGFVRVTSKSSNSGTSSTEPSTLFEVIFAWVEYLRASLISCDYSSEFDGSTTRFSIGEVIFIVLVAAIIVAVFLTALVPSQFLTIFGGVGVLAGLIVLVGLWWLAYDWSYGCLPGAPISFADDLVYFLAFNLLTRCTGGGFVDQPFYNNSNCAACENWSDGVWTIPNFVTSPADGGRFGFEDITYSLVFALRWLWPAALSTIQRDGPSLPVLGPLFSSALVQARLARFAELDFEAMSDTAYSQFILGFFITVVLHIIVFILFLVIANLILGLIARRLLGLLWAVITLAAATIPAVILGFAVLHDYALFSDQPDTTTPKDEEH